MIQSVSLDTKNHKLTDKSSDSKPDDKTSESFMELLNELKKENEPDTTNDLIPMISGFVEQIIEQHNQSAKLVVNEKSNQNEQQTSNNLISFISSGFENTIDANNPSLPLVEGKEKNLHKTITTQENITFETLTKLFSEATSPKERIQTFQHMQKAVEDQNKATFFLNKTENFVSTNPVEPDFDFQPQFAGKEVIFQSINRTGNDPSSAMNDQLPSAKVSVDQFFSEVIELIKNQTSLKKASEFIEAKFSLTPENLGDIDVKLSIQKGHVFAQFTTETRIGKETLESQLSLLRTSLQQQGFQVDKIEISLGGQGLQNALSQQGEKSRQEQPQQHFSKKKNSTEEFYQSHTTVEDWTRNETENSINILA